MHVVHTVLASIRKHRLLAGGDHVLLAVSGGADSTALLLILHELRDLLKLELTVAHLHHGIRGRAANADATFVQKLALRLGVNYIGGKAQVPEQARRKGLSLETAAREARYAFLQHAAHQARAATIATAHHADDQAETVLMKLLRGAGSRGLGGIAPATDFHGLNLIRPLLDIARSDLEAYLLQRGQEWQTDVSNNDTTHLRNRIRHAVIPFLKTNVNPEVTAALCRTADILRQENEWISALTRKAFKELKVEAHSEYLPVTPLQKRPVALQRRMLRLWLERAGFPMDSAASFSCVERLMALASEPGQTLQWSDGRRIRNDAGILRILSTGEGIPPPAFKAIALAVPGITFISALGVTVTIKPTRTIHRERGGIPGTFPTACTVGRNALTGPVHLRLWKPGDRIQPLGMNGSKKLQDVFTEAGVPREQRARVPVLECDGRILWVPGYRIGRGFEAIPGKPALAIRVELRCL